MALTISAQRPVDRAEEILTPEALAFIEELHQRFAATRGDLLKARAVKREEVAAHRPARFPAGDPRRPRGRLDALPPPRQPCRTAGWK